MTPHFTKTFTTSRWTLSHGLDSTQTATRRDYKCTSYGSAQSRTQMTNATITAANVGMQFMEIMGDYMEIQNTDDFDVQVHLMNLYEDLSNLYNDNNNE